MVAENLRAYGLMSKKEKKKEKEWGNRLNFNGVWIFGNNFV